MRRPKGFKLFVDLAGSYLKDSHKRSYLLAAVKDYAKNKKHLIQNFRDDLLTLVYLLRDWSKGRYPNVPPSMILLVVAALLYFLSPVDTIPDFLGAIGFTDDAAVVLFVLNALRNEIGLYRDWRSKQ